MLDIVAHKLIFQMYPCKSKLHVTSEKLLRVGKIKFFIFIKINIYIFSLLFLLIKIYIIENRFCIFYIDKILLNNTLQLKVSLILITFTRSFI